MQEKKTKAIDVSDLVFEDEAATSKPKVIDVSDLVFEDEPIGQNNQTLWQKAKGAVSKMLGNDVPTNTPMSEADYGELLKEDNDATVPSVAMPNLEENKTDPKWKVVQGEDGEFTTLPTGAAVGDEIAEGVHKSVAPKRPEVDSETEWKRGLLAKTTDVKTNVKNAKRVFEQGGYKLVGVVPNEEGSGLTQSNVYKLEKDGNEYVIDEDSFNSAIWDLRGDPVSTALTVATGGVGKAIGLGAVGNMVDQAISKLVTGEVLTPEQRALEVGKEAALFGGGEVVAKGAPLVLKLGKGAVHDVPVWASKKIYNYIAGGNIDGAKSLAKDLFEVDDAHMDDALNQMMQWQKEVYDGAANAKDNLENIKNGANKIEAVKQLGSDILSSAGKEQEQEKLLATVMAHPEGEKFIVPSLDGNFDAVTQVMRSVDNRRKQALGALDAATGTEIKNSVKRYEKNVKDDYSKMRDTFTDAFKESDYRFNLDDLKIEEKIKDMGSRIGDDYAQKQFEAMGNAIKSKIEGTRNGAGVTRNIDDLLDLWQRVNTFYGKYGKNLDKPDAQVFDSIKKGIGDEVDKALNEHTTPEIAKKLRSYFDDARDAYAKMYKVKGSKLYKSLMEEGKGSDDRVTALIKHAADDDGELHDLLSKLNVTDAGKAESAIVESVLRKHTIGERGKLQALDTAKALDELEKIKPFLKSDSVKEGIKLLEDMHQKFRHDFSLFKRASGVSVSTPSAGIATSAEGKLRAAMASKIFTYVKSMIPFSRDAKALALQRHLGVALEKSRSPLEMAKKMAISDAVSLDDKRELKELIRIHNRAKSADNKAKVQKIKDELKAFDEKMEKKQIQEALEVKEFKKPELAELRAVEQLTGDDRFGSFAQTVRAIQDDKANEVQIKKYLEAKRAVADNLDDAVDAERVQLLPYKYAKVGDDEIATLKRVADEVGDADFDHRKVKRLLYDLEKKGVPRDLEYDRLYDDMMSYAKESDVPTPKQTASTEHVLEEPLDANGNAVFSTPSHLGVGAGTGTVNAFTNADANGDGEVTQEEFVQAFLVGLAGGTVGSKAIALGLKKVNPELYGQMAKAVDDGVDADGLVGMFAGKKAKGFDDAVKFSDVADKKQRFWIDDGAAKLDDRKINNIVKNLKHAGTPRISSLSYEKLPKGITMLDMMVKDAKSSVDFITVELSEKELKKALPKDILRKIGKGEGEDITLLYDNRSKVMDLGHVDFKIEITQGEKLGDILKHDELFENYPELKDMDVAFMDNFNGAYLGQTIDENGVKAPIIVIGKVGKDSKSALLHEIQHAIQQKEGWARGGSLNEFEGANAIKDLLREQRQELDDSEGYEDWTFDMAINNPDLYDKLLDEGRKEYTLKPFYEEFAKHLPDDEQSWFVNRMLEFDKKISEHIESDPLHSYKRLAGEQEARATQAALKHPELTPYEALVKEEGKMETPLVRFEDGVSEMAPLESFGRNFTKYKSEPKKAIAKLMKEKNGQVKGALYHPEVGEIDLVWGKVTDPRKHTGYGLAHIIDKHGEEVAKRLDDIVMGAKVLKQKGNTVELINADDLAVIKLDWRGDDKKWVVTTFDMPPRQTITDDAVLVGESGNLSPKAESSIAQNTENVKKDAK